MKMQMETHEVVVFESVLYKTTTTLIIREKFLLLVDPNWLPSEIDFIKNYIVDVGKEKALYLMFTHSDFDHIIGAGAFPEAKMIASKSFVEDINRDKVIQNILEFDAQYYIDRSYSIDYPSVDYIIDKDGQQLKLEGETLTFYLAPGHTRDGLVLLVNSLEVLVVGDYLSDVEFPFIEDIVEYEDTLKKLNNIILNSHISHLIVGHGNSTSDYMEMKNRVLESMEYIRLLNGETNQTDELVKKYKFFSSMKDIHEANRQLIKKNKC